VFEAVMIHPKTSKQWIQRHLRDPYVQAAQKQGYQSRAAFKLLQIQEKYHLFRNHECVLDLGAAPGSWTQVFQKLLGPQGHIIAIDFLPLKHQGSSIHFIQGDITCEITWLEIDKILKHIFQNDYLKKTTNFEHEPSIVQTILEIDDFNIKNIETNFRSQFYCADHIVCDALPEQSGQRQRDVNRWEIMIQEIIPFLSSRLRDKGSLILKTLGGFNVSQIKILLHPLIFRHINFFKPQASRQDSSEIYLIARGYERLS
jgi:23S rRNA (uridine2552-2'-O)-methyltransferase